MDSIVVTTWLISIIVEVGFPFLVAIWLSRRFGLRWRVFWYGALVFLVAQLLIRVPLVSVLGMLGKARFSASLDNTLLYLLLLAFSAAAFEEVGRWLGYRYLFKRVPRNWENALMYGTGHEATESALLVGLSAAAGLIGYIYLTTTDPSALPGLAGDQLKAMQEARQQYLALQPWEPLLGGLERIFAMSAQISLSVLVLQCFTRNSALWLWIAIGWQMALDFGVAVIQYWTKALSSAGILITESWVLLIALASLWIIFRFRPRPAPTLLEPLAPLSNI